MITPLNQQESHALLRQERTGHLGCVFNGEPYVIPINYMFEDGSIYIHSLPGRKIMALRAHPRACLQVDQITDEFNWRSVLAFGDYEEIKDDTERDRILDSLFARFPHFTPVESAMAQSMQLPETILFRLRIERVTGVCEAT